MRSCTEQNGRKSSARKTRWKRPDQNRESFTFRCIPFKCQITDQAPLSLSPSLHNTSSSSRKRIRPKSFFSNGPSKTPPSAPSEYGYSYAPAGGSVAGDGERGGGRLAQTG